MVKTGTRTFLKILRIMIIAFLPLLLTPSCIPLTGYTHSVIKPRDRARPYNHLKDKKKKKTRIFWMKNK